MKSVPRAVSNVIVGQFENIVKEKKNPYVTVSDLKGREVVIITLFFTPKIP